MTPCWKSRTWPGDSNQTVSGKPGAVHTCSRIACTGRYNLAHGASLMGDMHSICAALWVSYQLTPVRRK